MPGPNSSPSGDASLVLDMRKVACEKHGRDLSGCEPGCRRLRQRDVLARQGRLRTGKTSARRGRA